MLTNSPGTRGAMTYDHALFTHKPFPEVTLDRTREDRVMKSFELAAFFVRL